MYNSYRYIYLRCAGCGLTGEEVTVGICSTSKNKFFTVYLVIVLWFTSIFIVSSVTYLDGTDSERSSTGDEWLGT